MRRHLLPLINNILKYCEIAPLRSAVTKGSTCCGDTDEAGPSPLCGAESGKRVLQGQLPSWRTGSGLRHKNHRNY